MPIKPISHSAFIVTDILRYNLARGVLDGRDTLMTGELMLNESAARVKLLAREMCRFINPLSHPYALLSEDEYEEFFLLTENNHAGNELETRAEKKLVSIWLNVLVNDRHSVCSIIECYADFMKKFPQTKDHLDQVLLKMILIPRAALVYFVDACIAVDEQRKMSDMLIDRQALLARELLTRFVFFKRFLFSKAAGEYAVKCLDSLKTFRVHSEHLLMRSFTLECIDDLHAHQWHDIRSNPNEFYTLPLAPQVRRPVRQERIEEPSPENTSIQSNTSSPLMMDSVSESPANAMFIQSLPSQQELPRVVKPQPVAHSTLIRNFSGLFIHNVMKSLRGSPVSVVPVEEDSVRLG